MVFGANTLPACMCAVKVVVQDRDICASFKLHVSLKGIYVQAKSPGFSEMHEGPCWCEEGAFNVLASSQP